MLFRTIISYPMWREQFITLFSVANFIIFEAYYYVYPSQSKTKQVLLFHSFLIGHYCNSSLNTLSWSISVWSRVTRTETLNYLRPDTEHCRATSLWQATTALFINPRGSWVFTELSWLHCVHLVIRLLIYRTVAQPSVSHI